MSQTAAIVVNWNGGPLLLDAIGSLVRQTARPEVWLVDNGSADGSPEAVAQAWPEVRILRQDSNRGFAAGNNVALREVIGRRHVLFFNNDAVLPDPESLEMAEAMLRREPSVNGVVGRYEYPDGRFQNYYNGHLTPFAFAVAFGVGRYCPPWRRGRALDEFYQLRRDFSQPGTMVHPAFVSLLARREAVARVGLLDEQFPIYFNDSDWCRRWSEAGYTWHYRPDWRVVHHLGQSTRKLSTVAQAEMAASALRYARKHFGGPPGWLAQASAFAEVCWRRRRHGEMSGRLGGIWRGETFFNRVPAPHPHPAGDGSQG